MEENKNFTVTVNDASQTIYIPDEAVIEAPVVPVPDKKVKGGVTDATVIS